MNDSRAFLDSIRPLYPFGVPRSSIKEIAFVVDRLDPEARVMLEAAVTKGMKLSLEAVSFESFAEGKAVPIAERVIYLGCGDVTSAGEACIRTVSVNDVLTSPESKRAFWKDLQKVMEGLS